MGKIEKEVKILNINKDEFIEKIKSLGAEFKDDVIQKLYTYDLPTISGRYYDILTQINMDYKYDVCVSKLKSLFFEIDNLLDDTKKGELYEITNEFNLSMLIDRLDKNNFVKLINSEKVKSFINTFNINRKKWIRLRQTNDNITLAVKHILSDDGSGIEQLLESEIRVPSFDDANDLLTQLGFSFKSSQEKRRITYALNDFEIDIDMWPMIPTYAEIEASSKEEIEKILNILGYKFEDTVSGSSDEIYTMYGLDMLKYRELILEEDRKK